MNMSHAARNHIISPETGVSQREISSSRHTWTFSSHFYNLLLAFLIPVSNGLSLKISLYITLPPSYDTSLCVPLTNPFPVLSSAITPSHLTASVCRCPFFNSQPAFSPKSHEALSLPSFPQLLFLSHLQSLFPAEALQG